MKRKPHSEETKEKIKLSKIGIQKPKITCPHCGKQGDKTNMNRWHNCQNQVKEMDYYLEVLYLNTNLTSNRKRLFAFLGLKENKHRIFTHELTHNGLIKITARTDSYKKIHEICMIFNEYIPVLCFISGHIRQI
jgi:hypothetical protein